MKLHADAKFNALKVKLLNAAIAEIGKGNRDARLESLGRRLNTIAIVRNRQNAMNYGVVRRLFVAPTAVQMRAALAEGK